MKRAIPAVAVLASLALTTAGAAGAGSALADDAEDPSENGIVYMVHGTFEPNPTAPTPAPPAHEALATTQQEGQIVLYVIPYSVETQAPTHFEDDTTITLEGQLPGQVLVVEPREGFASDDRCVDETTIPGHEGTTQDCLVATLDAEQVRGWGAVDITLEGAHQPTGETVVETYSAPAHVAMHTTMEDGQPGWETADQLSGISTPFVVEDLVDPVQ